jgi:hypothetical protein
VSNKVPLLPILGDCRPVLEACITITSSGTQHSFASPVDASIDRACVGTVFLELRCTARLAPRIGAFDRFPHGSVSRNHDFSSNARGESRVVYHVGYETRVSQSSTQCPPLGVYCGQRVASKSSCIRSRVFS